MNDLLNAAFAFLTRITHLNAEDAIYRGIPAIFGLVATYLFGVERSLMYIFVTLLVLDYITGFLAAWVSRTLSSDESLRGIAKKLGTIGLLVLAHQLDKLTNQGFPIIQTAAYWLLIANEGISITENLAELGVPIPDVVLKALDRIEGMHGRAHDEPFPSAPARPPVDTRGE